MRLDLGADESPAVFAKLVDAAIGAEVELPGGMKELLDVGRMADRCQMDVVRSAVEREGVARLDVWCCAQILKSTHDTKMLALSDAARELALHSFCEFAAGPEFKDLPAEVLLQLLEDDALVSEEGEDAVLAAVLAWVGAPPRAGRVQEAVRLLRAVRLRFVGQDYAEHAVASAPQKLRPPLQEALDAARRESSREEPAGLTDAAAKSNPKASKQPVADIATRGGKSGGSRQLIQSQGRFFTREERVAMGTMIYTLAASNDELFVAVEGGAIQVLDMATLQLKRTLEGHRRTVRAMLVHGGWLISGSDDDAISVWDVRTGERLADFRCFDRWCRALAVCGDFLVSGHGTLDRMGGGVRFWRMSKTPSEWKEEKYRAQGSSSRDVNCLAAVGSGLVAAGFDHEVNVYEVETGRKVAGPLRGSYDPDSFSMSGRAAFSAVTALAVAGRRLYLASRTCPVASHSIDTWEQVAVAEPMRPLDRSEQNERSLLPIGQALVTGASGPRYSATARYLVRVLDARTLRVLDVLPQGPGENILSLIAAGGSVWGAAGDKLVVWRRGGSDDIPHSEFVSWGPRRYQVVKAGGSPA